MSQVKKLQTGGTPEIPGIKPLKFEPIPKFEPAKSTTGSLTIDGKTYEATPELIQALTSHLSGFGETAAPLAGLTAALQRGENVVYDSIGNTITGMSGQWTGIDDKANTKRNSGTSQWRRNWQATFNTDAHKFRNAVKLLSGFIYNPSSEDTSNQNLKDIYGNNIWYKYDVGEDGKKTWLDNASENLSIDQRLKDWTSYLGGTDDDRKGFRLGSQYDDPKVEAIKNLYSRYTPETWDAYLKEIGNRAKTDTLRPEDIAFLANFNIVKPDEYANQGTGNRSRITSADRTKWNNAGFGGLADLLGDRAHLNDDGSLSLNDGESWGWNLGDLDGRNIWFNDDFYKSRYGADGSFDPFRGLTLYRNRLYTSSNPVLARILNSEGGFNSMMKAGNWTGADNEILTRFTDAARENPAYLQNDRYSTFLSNPNYRFSDLTGLVKTQDMNEDDQIIQYIDLSDDSLVGPYRQYRYKYALLDNRGNLKKQLNSEDLIDIQNGSSREGGLNTYRRISGNENQVYNNRYYEDILDKSGNATGFRFYRSISDPNGDVIMHMPKIYASDAEDKDIVLPKEVAQVLMQNKNWLQNVVGNAQNKENFMKIISGLVQSWWAKSDNLWYRNEAKELRKMGLSEEEVQKFLQAWNQAKRGNRMQRRQDMLVTAPQFKDGGVILEQSGGRAGGSKSATGVTEKRVNTINTNPNNAATIGDSKNWTDADTKDVVALLGDLGSLGLAFVPGANVGSATVGAASSTARFLADKERGTKGAGLNYLANLGMDAATLLPLIGGASKTAKTVKAVKNALPLIIKAASVYGLGSAVVNSANKIANGENWTVRDVSMVVNALTAGVGLSKQGGLGKSKVKVKELEPVTLKSKDGNISLTLNSEELKQIKDPDALLDAMFNKAKSSNTNLTKEQFGKQFDVNSLLKTATKWKPGWSPKNWFRKESVKTFNPKVKSAKQNVEAEEGSFKEWWHGVGKKQQNYNEQLRGNTTKEVTNTEQRIVIPENSKPGLMDLNVPAVVEQVPVTRTIKLPLQGIALPQWINAFTSANYQRNKDVQPSGVVMQPLYQKKGGKIIKAQSGTLTDKAITGNSQFKAVQDAQKWLKESKADDWSKIEGGNSGSQSDEPGKAYNLDFNPLMNWARAGISMFGSDKQLKNWLNRPRYRMQAPLLNAPRFVSSGAGDAYRQMASKLRLYKPISSDATDVDASQRARSEKALELELQGVLADANDFKEYMRGLDEFNNKNILQLTDIANQNRQFDWQHDIEDVQMKNANIAEKSKFFDQAAYATQDWYSRQHDLKNEIAGINDYNTELNRLQNEYILDLAKINARHKNDPDSDAAAQELAALRSQLQMKQRGLEMYPMKARLAFPFSAKRGGKIGKDSKVTYSRDPYPELLIQNSKDSTKLVEKLNDSVIKLLLQTKPIHVS